MPNDENWQKRSDDWVKMTHESRVKKEKELAEKRLQQKRRPTKTRSKKSPSKG
jgi:hypothetical protein